MHKECGASGGSKPVHIGDLCMGLISHLHCPYIPDEIVECLQPPQPGPITVDDQEESPLPPL